MTTELVPTDIANLIVSMYAEKIKDEEVNILLPPRFVQDAVLAEKGIKAPLGDAQTELARDWCSRQIDVQTRAMKASFALNEAEPLTQEMAIRGDLPRWAVEKWAVILLLDWSASLEDAVTQAEQYLEKPKSPTPVKG